MTEEGDQIHILNFFVGANNINSIPLTAHDKYKEVNDALLARFVSDGERVGKAPKESDEVWTKFLVALSRGKRPIDMTFDFNKFEGFSAEKATKLINHLPPTVQRLDIFRSDFGKDFNEGVVMWRGQHK